MLAKLLELLDYEIRMSMINEACIETLNNCSTTSNYLDLCLNERAEREAKIAELKSEIVRVYSSV